MAQGAPLHAFDFLEQPAVDAKAAIYAFAGDESFLKRECLKKLKALVLGDQDPALALSVFGKAETPFAEVRDELDTPPFSGGKRLVILEDADDFISLHRALVEGLFVKPPTAGVLIITAKTIASNTNLAKLLKKKDALIDCKAPKADLVPGWCVRWMKSQYERVLPMDTANYLAESVGAELGLLNQEMSKLSASIPDKTPLTIESVRPLINRSRVDQIWGIFRFMSNGQAPKAIALLHEVLDQENEPYKCLGAFSYQFRKLAKLARLLTGGIPQDQAMQAAGVMPFVRNEALTQLKNLGAQRLRKIMTWLIEADRNFKGGSCLSERTQLERLILKLASPSSQAQPTGYRR